MNDVYFFQQSFRLTEADAYRSENENENDRKNTKNGGGFRFRFLRSLSPPKTEKNTILRKFSEHRLIIGICVLANSKAEMVEVSSSFFKFKILNRF
jgi:hypothetical protein